jgi:hypothetical protein
MLQLGAGEYVDPGYTRPAITRVNVTRHLLHDQGRVTADDASTALFVEFNIQLSSGPLRQRLLLIRARNGRWQNRSRLNWLEFGDQRTQFSLNGSWTKDGLDRSQSVDR